MHKTYQKNLAIWALRAQMARYGKKSHDFTRYCVAKPPQLQLKVCRGLQIILKVSRKVTDISKRKILKHEIKTGCLYFVNNKIRKHRTTKCIGVGLQDPKSRICNTVNFDKGHRLYHFGSRRRSYFAHENHVQKRQDHALNIMD